MPATSTSQPSEKKATSAAQSRTAQPSAPGDINKVRTRSSADPQAKQPNKYLEARKFLSTLQVLPEGAPCTTQIVAEMLIALVETYKLPDNITKALVHVSEVAKHVDNQCQGCANTKRIPELIKELQGNLSKELDQKLSALESKLTTSSSPTSEQLETASKEIEQAARNIKEAVAEMGSSITKVTDTSSQLANTASSYKDALLNSKVQQPQSQSGPPLASKQPSQTDPRILRDVDRKARQILIDTRDEKLLNASLADIKEKVQEAIKAITNPPPLQNTTVLEINKLRKGGFTVLFSEKEVVSWLQDPGVEFEFTVALADDASITKRSFSMLVPRIPLTFDPTEDSHLREIEECNELPEGTIIKARWIKPINRRTPEQRAAHAIFALKDPKLANVCIRDGLQVCGLRIFPSRLKHEPMQCMKCRKWGHFANACTASVNTCGTCGGNHRTNECTVSDKTYCASCKTVDHTSWDRSCPEFQRRCGQFDENYPENNLPYFPTDEDWTLTTRPNRLQYEEKYPAKYAITAYPHPVRYNQATGPRTSGKQRKQQQAKVPANQSTMDRYLDRGNSQRSGESTDANADTMTAPGDADTTSPYFDCENHRDNEPQGWD